MIAHTKEKLDCFARVITPENIEFEYALAGPFQRLPAFLFDFAIRVLAFLAITMTLGIFSAILSFGGNVVAIASLLMIFSLSWFYGIFFETRYNGRTPGKMLFKLRVISVDGRPINGTQAALRNLLRLADMCLLLPLQVLGDEMPMAFVVPTLLIGFTVMTISPRMQRLGDLAAGTMVVSEATRRSPLNLIPEDMRAFGLAELIPATFSASSSLAQTIGLYMENRRRLSPLRRQEVAKHLSEPLIHRFGLLPDTSFDLLLCALYVRIFLSADQRSYGSQRLREMTAPAAHRNSDSAAVPPRPNSQRDSSLEGSTLGASPAPAAIASVPAPATNVPATNVPVTNVPVTNVDTPEAKDGN